MLWLLLLLVMLSLGPNFVQDGFGVGRGLPAASAMASVSGDPALPEAAGAQVQLFRGRPPWLGVNTSDGVGLDRRGQGRWQRSEWRGCPRSPDCPWRRS